MTLVDPRHQLGGDAGGVGRDAFDVAMLELGHAAAARVDDLGLDSIPCQHRAGGAADAGSTGPVGEWRHGAR